MASKSFSSQDIDILISESEDNSDNFSSYNLIKSTDNGSSFKKQLSPIPSFVDYASKIIPWPINQEKNEYNFDTGPFVIDSYCNLCNQSLPIGTSRIRCADCEDYDMCLPCACTLNVVEPHELSHRYIPICSNTFELFSEGWSADEEILLLEGISKYGFGNWKQVSEMVNRVSLKPKSSIECENHYNEVYISSYTCPYPDINTIRTPLKDEESKTELKKFFDNILETSNDTEITNADDVIISSEQLGCHSSHIPPPVNILKSNPSKLKLFQNFTGYNMYRDELDNEYYNDAEFILKDVEFNNYDSPSEINFKVQLIELYNSFLDERIYRKRILIHRFWNDFQVREKELQHLTDTEKLVYWRLAPLIRFQSEDEHIRLTQLLVAKCELQRRMDVVQQWKSLGLKTVDDIIKFDFSRLNIKQNVPKNKVIINKLNNDHILSHVEDINTRFCNDFNINQSQLDDIFNKIIKKGIKNNGPIEINKSCILPLWDICLNDNNIYLNKSNISNIRNMPSLDYLDDDCELRIILDTVNNEYNLKGINLSNLRFDKDTKSIGLEQSNVISNRDTHLYATKFNNELNKTHKISKRRKRV